MPGILWEIEKGVQNDQKLDQETSTRLVFRSRVRDHVWSHVQIYIPSTWKTNGALVACLSALPLKHLSKQAVFFCPASGPLLCIPRGQGPRVPAPAPRFRQVPHPFCKAQY
jgi:hypothetical protein